MLIRFRVENFRSIRDEQELSLVASALTEHPEMVREVNGGGLRLLPAAAIYGPNASGKSTLLAALQFMRTAVLDSHRNWSPAEGVPSEPFFFDFVRFLGSSSFVIDFLVQGVRYEFGFVVDANRVLEEWLYAWPRGKKQEWFTRSADRDVEITFNRALPGENRAISALTRPNSLFLSAAAQNNHPALLPLYLWFSRQLWIIDDSNRSSFLDYAIEQCRDGSYRDRIFSLMRAADLGIAQIRFVEPEEATTADSDGVDPGSAARWLSAPVRRRARVEFGRATSEGVLTLPFEAESRGTRTLFSLLGVLTWSLTTGGTVLVDELDQSLHPELAQQVVRLFTNAESNPHGAQLVFNTHDTNLLDADLLRRDQVWFTEKGSDGATRLYPLTDFHARKQENLERGYLQGRYGAIPSLDTSVFEHFAGEG